MPKSRLEAFSDGVIAIIITIMVLELRAPADRSLHALAPLVVQFFSYLLSFIYVGIYWNNHHHLLHAARQVTGMVLWANMHLLFWLSLIPAVTSWMGVTHFGPWPVAAYGIVLLMCATAWGILGRVLVKEQGEDAVLNAALGRGRKQLISVALYLAGIAAALVGLWRGGENGGTTEGMIGSAIYGVVAVIWFVPEKRVERAAAKKK